MSINCYTTSTLGTLGTCLLLALLTFSACSRKANANKEQAYLPTFLKEVQLGQSQATVLKTRPNAYVVNTITATTWEEYTEDVDIENYTSVYYSFDKTGDKPLVSIALLHKDEGSAAATFKNFGGEATAENLNERMRTGDQSIHASKKGRRVLIYLPEVIKKRAPTFDQ